MALSQTQWLAKLKKFVPGWVFSQANHFNEAIFSGIAKVFERIQLDYEDHTRQTFIADSDGEYLDLHGSERRTIRIAGENDPTYAPRIQVLKNKSSCPKIKEIVDNLLLVGIATVQEDFDSTIFADREHFINRGEIIIDIIRWAFTILLDRQIHAPYSFLDREHFADREDFVGEAETSDLIYASVLEAVSNAKAFGVLYRIIERFEE